MPVELALDDLLRGLDDRLAKLGVEPPERHICLGSGTFDDAKGAHDCGRLLLPADLEVCQRALGLRAPVAVRRHFNRSESVGLGAGFLHGHARGPLRLLQGMPQ